MKKTFNIGRTTAIALPLIMAGGIASAGGLAEPVVAVAPTPVMAPAPVMTGTDWTGFYAGAQLGYGKLEPNGVTDPTEPDGALYGVHAGYMYDLGNIVLGAELDYDATNISFVDPASDLDSIARAKLRVGYDAGAFLPYVTAGRARATTTGDLDGHTDGNFAGLGVVYKMNNNALIGGEILRHQFEDVVGNIGDDMDATTATLRVSFQF